MAENLNSDLSYLITTVLICMNSQIDQDFPLTTKSESFYAHFGFMVISIVRKLNLNGSNYISVKADFTFPEINFQSLNCKFCPYSL